MYPTHVRRDPVGARNIESYLTGFIKLMGWDDESVVFHLKQPHIE
jgi:hypothetical protein